jgi:hypothetical protein
MCSINSFPSIVAMKRPIPAHPAESSGSVAGPSTSPHQPTFEENDALLCPGTGGPAEEDALPEMRERCPKATGMV